LADGLRALLLIEIHVCTCRSLREPNEIFHSQAAVDKFKQFKEAFNLQPKAMKKKKMIFFWSDGQANTKRK
jgi:hypothetical protein